MTWKARFLWVFLASIALTVLAAITAVLFDNLSISDTVLVSSLIFAVHALGALIGAVLWQRKPTRRMVVIGIVVGVLGGLIWLLFVWLDEFNVISWRHNDYFVKPAGTGSTLGVALLARGLVLWPQGRSVWVRVLRIGAWVAGWLAAAVLLHAIWTDRWHDETGKLFAVLLILSTGATVGVFIVDRLTRGDLIEHDDSALGVRMLVSVRCPRCGEPAELQANTQGRCDGCGLKLRLEFEEPRCTCGYLLHGLTGEVCPECGKPISDRKGWGASANPPLSDGEPASGAEGD